MRSVVTCSSASASEASEVLAVAQRRAAAGCRRARRPRAVGLALRHHRDRVGAAQLASTARRTASSRSPSSVAVDRCAMTSVSVSAVEDVALRLQPARSSSWFSMMPLCTTAISPRDNMRVRVAGRPARRASPSACARCRWCRASLPSRLRERGRRRAPALRSAASEPSPSRRTATPAGVVAAVFEAPQALEQDRDDVALRDRADDSAHGTQSFFVLLAAASTRNRYLLGARHGELARPACSC